MISIRNQKTTLGDNDDMLPKSAEIWVNELQLTDFDNKSGWAATGRLRLHWQIWATSHLLELHLHPVGSIEKN